MPVASPKAELRIAYDRKGYYPERVRTRRLSEAIHSQNVKEPALVE